MKHPQFDRSSYIAFGSRYIQRITINTYNVLHKMDVIKHAKCQTHMKMIL